MIELQQHTCIYKYNIIIIDIVAKLDGISVSNNSLRLYIQFLEWPLSTNVDVQIKILLHALNVLRRHMYVVPRSTMNTNGETEN